MLERNTRQRSPVSEQARRHCDPEPHSQCDRLVVEDLGACSPVDGSTLFADGFADGPDNGTRSTYNFETIPCAYADISIYPKVISL